MRLLPSLIVTLAVLGTFATLAIADRASHSVSDTLYAASVPAGIVWLLAVALLFMARRRAR